MPKSPPSAPDEDDDKFRVADVVARKKKNADAQAAFRQRRATYISSLEETVVSLEDVVVQLQDSCREHKATTDTLQQEVKLLKHEGREREKMWRALWSSMQRQMGQPDEPAPVPESSLFTLASVSSPTIVTQPSPTMTTSSHVYEDSSYSTVPGNSSAYASTSSYPNTGYPASSSGSAMVYHPPLIDPRTQHMSGDGSAHYGHYGPYPLAASSARDPTWTHVIASPSETAPSTTPPAHSPTAYADHSNPMMYGNPYLMNEPSQHVPSVHTAGYRIEQSPSNSAPSTPVSTSSTMPAGGRYSYGLMENPEAHEHMYPRSNGHGHGIPMTLHGGLADVSASISSTRGFRPPIRMPEASSSYSNVSPTHVASSPIQEHCQAVVACPPTSNSSKSRETPSRSASPTNDGHVSSTLAVIKQQAFGTMRRTNRTRSKASTTNAKKAIEKLEARGANLGLDRLPKRQRTNSDDDTHT